MKLNIILVLFIASFSSEKVKKDKLEKIFNNRKRTKINNPRKLPFAPTTMTPMRYFSAMYQSPSLRLELGENKRNFQSDDRYDISNFKKDGVDFKVPPTKFADIFDVKIPVVVALGDRAGGGIFNKWIVI